MTVEEACRTLIPGYDPWRDAGGWTFDAARAEDAVGFFRDMLTFPDGEHAGQPFILQPWQQAIIGNIYGWEQNGRRRYREAFIYLPRKNGKMLALDTPLPTPTGWTTMGEVRVGDALFDEYGRICRVTDVSDIDLSPESYRIQFSNGESVRACADHQWLTTARVNAVGVGVGSRDWSLGSATDTRTRVRTTREIFETQAYGRRKDRNHSVAMPRPIDGADRNLLLPPYVLGVWLGDGHSRAARITSGDEDKDWMAAELRREGIPVQIKLCAGKSPTLALTDGRSSRSTCVATKLRRLGVLGGKHIPIQYLRASVASRLALLQGLMDTDGTISKSGRVLQYVSVSKPLADCVGELLASMGVKYSLRTKQARCNGRLLDKTVYMLQFMAFADDLPVFRLPRKLSRMRLAADSKRAARSRSVQIVSVERIQPTPMRCISVDSPSNLYLFGRTMLPTHNTAMSAGMLMLEMFMRPTPGGQYFSAASTREQAALIFKDACRMVKANDEMSELIRIVPSSKVIERIDDMGGFYRSTSSDAGAQHGTRPCFAIIDELHAHRNANLVEALTTGTAVKGLQPLIVYITTADYIRESVCNTKYKYACQVRDGGAADPSFLPVIYEAPQDADWTSPEVWKLANPNYGISVDEEYLARECEKAKVNPTDEIGFKRLHLCMQTAHANRLIQMPLWNACYEDYDADDLLGQECYGGMDLATEKDFSAFVLYFPKSKRTLAWFWCPIENAAKRQAQDGIAYQTWMNGGYIEPTDGDFISQKAIGDKIESLAALYDIRTIAFDRAQAAGLYERLSDYGLVMLKHSQLAFAMASPTKKFQAMVGNAEIRHNGHPVLNWNIQNAVGVTDAFMKTRPDREKSLEKIDGVVALIMAISAADTAKNETFAYEIW